MSANDPGRNGFYFEVYKSLEPKSNNKDWEANLKCGTMNMDIKTGFATEKDALTWCVNYFNSVPIFRITKYDQR